MKIALAQVNPTIGALAENAETIATQAARARAAGAELAIFPEMAICGYPARDLVEKPEFVAASLELLREASRQVPEITILCGCATAARAETGKSVHNSALALEGGEVVFQQSKMLLPTYDVFDELRNFAPAERQRVWIWRERRIAVTICEDAWNDKHYWPKKHARLLYTDDPVADQLRHGADFLINISASPYCRGKIALRQEMLGAIAREYRVPVILVNQVGGDDQLVFDGSSLVLGEYGDLRARASSFAEDLLLVEAGEWRGPIRAQPEHETAAAWQALVLGTRDYVRKCGFRQVLVGLSGGIDSALTAAIAAEALGPKAVLGLAMPSRYSSQASLEDARRLAGNLGIELRVEGIEAPLTAFLQSLETGLAEAGREENRGVTEQNLQARIRGTVLMAYSNRTGALVLSTGNKSELATGYCTLYGDMAGGLAVISDVLKTQVYELARYANRERELIPRAILEKAPSAELRPEQIDEQDLPPYPILDGIIHDYVEEYKSAEQIAAERNLDAEMVMEWIMRIDRSEYKRQQAAPGLKISKKAFGMGRRFPIAQHYDERNAAAEPVATRTGRKGDA